MADRSDHPYVDYSLWIDQAAIDEVALGLAEYGYDVGDRPVVPAVGVTPNLRLAVAAALRRAACAATSREDRS